MPDFTETRENGCQNLQPQPGNHAVTRAKGFRLKNMMAGPNEEDRDIEPTAPASVTGPAIVRELDAPFALSDPISTVPGTGRMNCR